MLRLPAESLLTLSCSSPPSPLSVSFCSFSSVFRFCSFQMQWMEKDSSLLLLLSHTPKHFFLLPLSLLSSLCLSEVWWDSSAVWADCLSRIWPQQCCCSADLCVWLFIASSCESYVKYGGIMFFFPVLCKSLWNPAGVCVQCVWGQSFSWA